MAISPQQLTIYLYSAHRAVIFAIAQLSCYTLFISVASLFSHPQPFQLEIIVIVSWKSGEIYEDSGTGVTKIYTMDQWTVRITARLVRNSHIICGRLQSRAYLTFWVSVFWSHIASEHDIALNPTHIFFHIYLLYANFPFIATSRRGFSRWGTSSWSYRVRKEFDLIRTYM